MGDVPVPDKNGPKNADGTPKMCFIRGIGGDTSQVTYALCPTESSPTVDNKETGQEFYYDVDGNKVYHTATCVDDPDFYHNKEKKTCAWVADQKKKKTKAVQETQRHPQGLREDVQAVLIARASFAPPPRAGP